jgi:hypothetical protein
MTRVPKEGWDGYNFKGNSIIYQMSCLFMFVYVPSNMLNLQIFTLMQKKVEFFFTQNSYWFLKQLKKKE